MNSDPFDSAAWRTFGMLDADESAIFDGALRHDRPMRDAYVEMDRLAAAIAVSTATPVAPPAHHLEQIRNRLGLNPSKRKYYWTAISGWLIAALISLGFLLNSTSLFKRPKAKPSTSATHTSNLPAPTPSPRQQSESPPADTPSPSAPKSASKVETKRLIQEIEVLRNNLEKFHDRDRALFQPEPGVALPLVMTMNPPGVSLDESPNFDQDEGYSPITTMLGDALTTLTGAPTVAEDELDTEATDETDLLPEYPTAIPIYDAARDSGTLVVSNLPPAAVGQVYNLWVATETGGDPVYVGSLPEGSASGADSFDFSLGSTMLLPTGFLLTLDPQNAPAKPTETNTILKGPPLP